MRLFLFLRLRNSWVNGSVCVLVCLGVLVCTVHNKLFLIDLQKQDSVVRCFLIGPPGVFRRPVANMAEVKH